MQTFIPTNKRPNLLVLLLALLLVFCLFSCRTKKSVIDKKEESVSVLEKKDVLLSEKERVETSTIDLTNSKSWSVTPVDSNKSTKVVYKGDTISLLNAKLEVNKTDTQSSSVTSGSRESDHRDLSTTKVEAESSSKKKDLEVQSSSWGLNIGIILGVLVLVIITYLDFKNPL